MDMTTSDDVNAAAKTTKKDVDLEQTEVWSHRKLISCNRYDHFL